MEFLTELGYFGLFISAFLAATILPLSSELVLTGLIIAGLPVTTLVAVATLGNVLGSFTNYALGYWASMGLVSKWLRVSQAELDNAENRFKRYGVFSLCFSWVPVIGDPITLIAGILRVNWVWFACLVTLGKLLRYVVIGYFVT